MKKLLLLAFSLIAFSGLALAARTTGVYVEYADPGNLVEVRVGDAKTKLTAGSIYLDGDTALPPKAQIVTGNATVELRVEPTGSIIKIGKNSTFVVEYAGDKSAFKLDRGTMRAVVAKSSTGAPSFSVTTPAAACGVRGTILSGDAGSGDGGAFFCDEGELSITRLNAAGEAFGDAVSVKAGEFVDALAGVFAPAKFTPAMFGNRFGPDFSLFKLLDPATVPGHAEAPATPAGDAAAPPAGDGTTPPAGPGAAAGDAGGKSAEGAAAGTPAGPDPFAPFWKWMKDVLGMEIGTITIDGTVYSKAVLQPVIDVGSLKLGLYLPIIYSTNMFDPADWYKPQGNNEWSFGFDYFNAGDAWGGVGDLLSDLFLKVKFAEYGKQGEPFYLKVGNLSDMTIGHGVLMSGYANDYDFPAVRRIGLNFGLDFGAVGFEAVVNDLAKPEVMGGRLFARPFGGFPLAFGLSAIVDIDPASALPATTSAASLGDPTFMGLAFDLGLPILNIGIFNMNLYGDVAGLVPYTKTAYTVGPTTVAPGFHFESLWDSATSSLKNVGFVAGLGGNVLFIDYKLEFRYFTGKFRPNFFNSVYDRTRGALVTDYAAYLADPVGTSAPTVMGVYGEGGFSLLDGKIGLDIGYFWPWTDSAVTIEQQLAASEDFLLLTLTVKKGAIPGFDISGSISYARRGFARTIAGAVGPAGSPITLLDENTVFSGELSVPVSASLDIAITVTTAAMHDASGAPVFYAGTDRPMLEPVIALETRFHF